VPICDISSPGRYSRHFLQRFFLLHRQHPVGGRYHAETYQIWDKLLKKPDAFLRHRFFATDRDKGLMGTILRYPYEVRDAQDYFDDIQDVKVTKDMLDLAKHIVTQKAATFDPEKFEDHYEEALTELINAQA
jgi:hypothetical protein